MNQLAWRGREGLCVRNPCAFAFACILQFLLRKHWAQKNYMFKRGLHNLSQKSRKSFNKTKKNSPSIINIQMRHSCNGKKEEFFCRMISACVRINCDTYVWFYTFTICWQLLKLEESRATNLPLLLVPHSICSACFSTFFVLFYEQMKDLIRIGEHPKLFAQWGFREYEVNVRDYYVTLKMEFHITHSIVFMLRVDHIGRFRRPNSNFQSISSSHSEYVFCIFHSEISFLF